MTTAHNVTDPAGNYQFTAAIHASQIVQLALEILDNQIKRGDLLTQPKRVKEFLVLNLGGEEQEVFACIFLDNRHRVISFDRMFYGTIDGASVYPREVVKRALKHNAAAIILAHNHPSGVPEPSGADVNLTQRLKTALDLVDVRVLDHIVVGAGDSVSFAERGLI